MGPPGHCLETGGCNRGRRRLHGVMRNGEKVKLLLHLSVLNESVSIIFLG